MLDPIYIESKKTFVKISDVENEDAFETLVHFVHGCEIKLTRFGACDLCNYSAWRHSKTIPASMNQDNESAFEWHFAMDLLACSERFFVDELKRACELYLRSRLSNKNIGEIFILSCWHSSRDLSRDVCLFLMTRVDCPMYRCKYFAEILCSHEKEAFLSLLYLTLHRDCF